ncbi:hypothetical protein RND81_04G085100 [Saponaria officinalis]|uniref:Transposase MuDR plant domain-containing protein n=1 Tax=Saponaria officinalis TaxID=3572 RepID=A0AAW1LJJ5_SAPOF
MENIVLKMHFKGACVDVKVDDTDRCVLIDVINDFVDEAEKRGVILPKSPSFKYCYDMRYISLIDDNTLLEMFKRFEGKKTIDIWIGFDVKPSTVLLMARKVRDQSTAGVDEIQPHDLNVLNESNVVEINPNENNPNEPLAVLTSPRRSQRLSQNTEVSKGTQTSQKQSNEPKFKMPKTSAKRKGVYVPKNQKPPAESEVVGNSLVTRGTRVQYDEVEGSSDFEGSYLPSGDDMCEEEEDDLADLDNEDNVIISSLDYIDDGYDPYAQQEWTGDDGGYISQALANGELYDDKEFGSIMLRPWQLFLDKQHFRYVLRDFCIQEGFYVIVHKTYHKRYTADCATANCKLPVEDTC